jgi:hypothetical protein
VKKRIIITINLNKMNKIRISGERGSIWKKIPKEVESVAWIREIKDIARIIPSLTVSTGTVEVLY